MGLDVGPSSPLGVTDMLVVDQSVPSSSQSLDNIVKEVLHPDYFTPPVSRGGRVVEIFTECTQGTCDCVNVIGNVHCNLKPCRVAFFLFNGEFSLPQEDVDRIWNGLCDGFPIVDMGFNSSYECANYHSITEGSFREEMSSLLCKELSEGKVSKCENKPQCIHALGAVQNQMAV